MSAKSKEWTDNFAETDEDTAAETMTDTTNWFECNCDLDYPYQGKLDWEAHNETIMELDNEVSGPESPVLGAVSAAKNVFWFIWPIQMLMKKAEKMLIMVNTM